MASVFTYDPDPPRVSSPWSNSGTATPQLATTGGQSRGGLTRSRNESSTDLISTSNQLADYGISKLEPEPQEGPTEYKLHLLLRPRRLYTSMSTGRLVGGAYHSRLNHAYSASLSISSPTTTTTAAAAATTTTETSTTMLQTGSDVNLRSSQVPSSASRQQRLHSLTTQLLWRLQQSSPFHSSTTATLVLPALPEATPRLGLPQMPARLLPGLEESQGALYEIGVADDGTFVGLTNDELDESLNNLRTMAASLGCKAEILRKVVVGTCEWVTEGQADDGQMSKVNSENLLVAEALISPDLEYYNSFSGVEIIPDEPLDGINKTQTKNEQHILESGCSPTEQVRISIAGPSGAGKSSLLGTLSTSALDNGRGMSRLSLLKHRHEISSGITSSVTQELIGYTAAQTINPAVAFDVVNYASGNVTAWTDIHAASEGGRLAFLSDLPGLTRYVKSTMRGLISWAPHYVLLCIPSNCSDPDEVQESSDQMPDINICLAYLELCIKLEIPILIAITKLDLASRSNLKATLSKILSAVKLSQKKPIMLSVTPEIADNSNLQGVSTHDAEEVLKVISSMGQDHSKSIPILLTSAVSGSGIGKLHALLRLLPIPNAPVARALDLSLLNRRQDPGADLFDVDEVFAIPPSKVYSSPEVQTKTESHGVVLCGLMRRGNISVNDELVLGPIISEGAGGSPRSRPYKFRHTSNDFSPSLIQDSIALKSYSHLHAEWQRVRVVSVRNLRLSVRTLLQDQVGTIGVEPIAMANDQHSQAERTLGRLRKGLVLTSKQSGAPRLSRDSITPVLPPSRGFVAKFSGREFASPASPPLILGGNAVIYIASIRTAAKVICVALDDGDDDGDIYHQHHNNNNNDGDISTGPSSPTGSDLFTFDDDNDDHSHGINEGQEDRLPGPSHDNKTIRLDSISPINAVKVTFHFLYSVEIIEIGSLVAIIPGVGNTTTTSSSRETVLFSGLEGFIGHVCDIVPLSDNHHC